MDEKRIGVRFADVCDRASSRFNQRADEAYEWLATNPGAIIFGVIVVITAAVLWAILAPVGWR